jgi:tetratricopeptide (TPR) repeat protein
VRTLALLLLAAAASAQGRPADADIAAGRDAFDAGKYTDAITCFARARLADPRDWRGHAYTSLTLLQQAMRETGARRLDLAREAERVAGELVKLDLCDFHDPLYRFIKGLVCSLEGDDAKAYVTLSEALRSPPEKFAMYEEVELHRQVQRAYAVCGIRVAGILLAAGRFELAETEMTKAGALLPEDDPERARFERVFAAVSENLNKIDKAIAHLRACIALSKDPAVVDELTGTIALIHINNEQLEKGREVLAQASKESRQPELVAARCTLIVRDALREGGARLDEALSQLRDAMLPYPPEQVYRLVLLYRDLLLTRVGMREAQTPEGQALLKDALPIFLREIERRPECPPLYFAVYRVYKLLGDAEQERRYQDLHERRKKEFEQLDKYDQYGRPRCGN